MKNLLIVLCVLLFSSCVKEKKDLITPINSSSSPTTSYNVSLQKSDTITYSTFPDLNLNLELSNTNVLLGSTVVIITPVISGTTVTLSDQNFKFINSTKSYYCNYSGKLITSIYISGCCKQGSSISYYMAAVTYYFDKS